MAIINTPLLGLPYAGADTDETYAVLAGLFVKDGKKLTLPEIVEKYTPTVGTVHIKAADWTAADGTEDAYDAKIKINGVEAESVILIYPLSSADTEKAKRLGIRAKTLSGSANDDTFVIVRATGGAPTVADGISLVYIAFRGYPVWNEGLTPPAMPYATVIGVDPYIATEEGDRDDIAASQRLVTSVAGAIRKSVDDLAKTAIDKSVTDLVNYYNKSQTLTKDEINALVSAIPKFKIEVVTSLPTSNISDTTVYLVKSGDDDSNLYTEYIRAGGKWEKLGTQTVDLTGYATEAWVNDILAAYVKTVDMEAYVAGLLKDYITKEDADKIYQPAGDYPTTADMGEAISEATKDLAPKSSIPTVPTKVSQLTNDSGYLNATTGDQRYAKPDDVVAIMANNKDEIAESVADKMLEPIVGRNKYNEDNSIPYTSSLTGNCLRGTAYLPPTEGQYTIYISSAGSGNYTYIYDPSQNDLLKTDTMVVYDANGVAVSDVTFSSSPVRNSTKTRSGKTLVVPAGANAHKLEFLYRVSSGSGATLCSEMMVTIGYMPEEYEPYEETLVLDGLDYATNGDVAKNYVSKKIYYVSTRGSDENDGSKDAPLATLKKALDLGAARIAMEVGEYFVPTVVTLSNLNDVRIYAYRDGETYDHAKPVRDKVRITGAKYYLGYAKNADGVYQQAGITGGFNYREVFVDKSKSPAINARTYHANLMVMHEDVSKDYYLKPVLTYDECKTTANTFFWDGSTLSFNASSTDFAKVGVIYAEQCLLINNCTNLVMEDIAVEMCKSNVIGINDCGGIVLNNCEANASAISMGFAFDNTNGVLNNCYATKNAYDGFNFHGYGTTTMNDCTAENNYDDGCSHHDGCIGTINGGRFMGSGKAGIAPAYGANVNIYNVIASDNNIGIGYLTTSNGHASMRGIVSGCALIDNNTGLQVDALASAVTIGCKYHGNTTDKATTGSLEEY